MKHSSSRRLCRTTTFSRDTGGTLTLKDMMEAVEKMLEKPEIPMCEAARYMNLAKEQIEGNYNFDPLRYVLTRKEPMYIEPKYSVGDVIRVVQADPARPHLLDQYATVKRVLRNVMQPVGNPFYYLLDFGKHIQGHDGEGVAPYGHCWALPEEFITKHNGPMPKKGGNMSALSTLAKRTFDADTKALVKIGLLDEGLRVADPGLLLEMLVSINYKPLAEEAAKRLAEAEAESKE